MIARFGLNFGQPLLILSIDCIRLVLARRMKHKRHQEVIYLPVENCGQFCIELLRGVLETKGREDGVKVQQPGNY